MALRPVAAMTSWTGMHGLASCGSHDFVDMDAWPCVLCTPSHSLPFPHSLTPRSTPALAPAAYPPFLCTPSHRLHLADDERPEGIHGGAQAADLPCQAGRRDLLDLFAAVTAEGNGPEGNELHLAALHFLIRGEEEGVKQEGGYGSKLIAEKEGGWYDPVVGNRAEFCTEIARKKSSLQVRPTRRKENACAHRIRRGWRRREGPNITQGPLESMPSRDLCLP